MIGIDAKGNAIAYVRKKLLNSNRLDTFAAISSWFDPYTGEPTCAPCQMIRVSDEYAGDNFEVEYYYSKVGPEIAKDIEDRIKELGRSYFKLEKPDL